MEIADRTWWEGLVFFAGWSGGAIYAFARRHPGRAHRELLFGGGTLALLIPVANGFATGDWPWVALREGLTSVVGVDLAATLLGLAAMALSALVRPRQEESYGGRVERIELGWALDDLARRQHAAARGDVSGAG